MATHDKSLKKAHLLLKNDSRGFIVCGDTYTLKDMLKAEGGKWNSMEKGWVFPLTQKAALKRALKALKEVERVDDKAILNVFIQTSDEALIVKGETFHFRELLKAEGGRWDGETKCWVFKTQQKQAVIATLRASESAEIAEEAVKVPLQSSKALAVAAPMRSTQNLAIRKGQKHAKALQNKLATQPTPSRKVMESEKRSRRVEKGSDGSRADTQMRQREQKVSCKRTGAHLETRSVKKKKKVVEKKGKIIETATITVKRIRAK